ncbi:hypothetical protein [uncultured Bacteroides sp.]|uniref:hypothetical protein n=1 Tax=uncultured Bacteroides sp. TaxID=162156 RepID=UPI0025EC3CD1|nr:hypothetical protein [uncultured Bacteroides sp.]
MAAIGGYLELELRKGVHYHEDAIRLNSARNCFEYILLARKYTKIYIPYYTCEVLLQPLIRHRIAYEFYSINEDLEPAERKQLSPGEAFLYTNYFGLKQLCIERLSDIYGTQLIVDNAQAFYASCLDGVDTFFSPRKFFGVADGGYIYTDCVLETDLIQSKSYTRMQHLLERIDESAESGYISFRKNDDALDNQPICEMSRLTDRILCGIDYDNARSRRIDNFLYLHQSLQKSNSLRLELHSSDVPMVYPFYTEDPGLRSRLITEKIFVATYWSNVQKWCKPKDLEYALVNHIIPLPIDQRYGNEEMKRILTIIQDGKI